MSFSTPLLLPGPFRFPLRGFQPVGGGWSLQRFGLGLLSVYT